MLQRLFADRAVSTLAAPIADTVATSCTVTTGHGARFPALSGGDTFLATLEEVDGGGAVVGFERVTVTARSGDTLTIVRGQDFTTARPFPSGARVELRVTASAFALLREEASWFSMARGNMQMVLPNGAGSNSLFAQPGFTIIGTAQGRNPAATNRFTRQSRIGYLSSATANNSAGVFGNARLLYPSDGAGNGGFVHYSRFGVSDPASVADSRMFAGMTTAVSPNQANISTLTDIIAVGCDNAQTNLRLCHNDSSGAPVVIDLGSGFPTTTSVIDWYELFVLNFPNATAVHVGVRNATTGAEFAATLTSDIPSPTTLLTSQVIRHNGTTALAVATDVGSIWQRSFA